MRVLVFGDSIAQGFFDAKGGWVVRLRTLYSQKPYQDRKYDEPPTVFNLGISGDSTASVLKRFDFETAVRKWPGEEFIFVFAIGANDTVYRGEEYDSKPETYRQQLAELVKQARQYSAKILFVGLFPVIDELLQPMPWSSTGKCYSTERINLFNDTLKKFCKDNSLPFVDLFTEFSRIEELNEVLADGIHPNEKGHQLIADLVKPELDMLL